MKLFKIIINLLYVNINNIFHNILQLFKCYVYKFLYSVTLEDRWILTSTLAFKLLRY